MSSLAIKGHLETHRVLQAAIQRGHLRDEQQQQPQQQQAGDYKLIITGAPVCDCVLVVYV
jgi:hypothetical protein